MFFALMPSEKNICLGFWAQRDVAWVNLRIVWGVPEQLAPMFQIPHPAPPKKREAVATLACSRRFRGCSAIPVRHSENIRRKVRHQCSATAVARRKWCSVWATQCLTLFVSGRERKRHFRAHCPFWPKSSRGDKPAPFERAFCSSWSLHCLTLLGARDCPL